MTLRLSREQYLLDFDMRAGSERHFEVIGKALKQLFALEPSLRPRFPEADEAMKYRNFLAHAYYLVDHTLVWEIMCRDVRPLRDAAGTLLAERAA